MLTVRSSRHMSTTILPPMCQLQFKIRHISWVKVCQLDFRSFKNNITERCLKRFIVVSCSFYVSFCLSAKKDAQGKFKVISLLRWERHTVK